MTDNFNNALKRAKELLNDGRHPLSIISEVANDFVLTGYEENELSDEIYNLYTGKAKYYMTLGSGQPHYPGYFVCEAESEVGARMMTNRALNGRWCGTYESLDQVHPNDRVCRGTIDELGAHHE